MKTCLITGASGFFGHALLQALSQQEGEGPFICLYHSQKGEVPDARFIWVKANLLDVSCHRSLMETYQPTHCAHLAWHVPPQNFWHAQENLEWLHASIHLFQAFSTAGGKNFMGAGSLTEYDNSTGVFDEETTPLKPNSLYGQCKKSLYEILNVIRNSHYPDVRLLWPRIGYFFGEREPSQKLISKIIHHISTGTPLNLLPKGTKRPYAHVKYLGHILAHLLLHQEEDRLLNVSASQAYALDEMVDYVCTQLNVVKAPIAYSAYAGPTAESLMFEVNTKRLERLLGNNLPDTFFEDLKSMVEFKKVIGQEIREIFGA